MTDDGLVTRLDEYVIPLDRAAPSATFDPNGDFDPNADADSDADADSNAAFDPSADTDSDAGLDDLRPLADVFADRTVVGLGEATHGTREFFQLKHRLVRLLVTELDFRLFAIEANFSEALAVDRYVVSGEGDPADALAGLRFWTWNTEETLALVEWLREYNEGRPADEKVRFYGFDAQFTRGAVTALAEFFERVDPEYLDEIRDDLETLAARPSRSDHDARKEWLTTAERLLEEMETRLERDEADYRSSVTDREWRLVRRHRRVLEQAFELAVARTFDDGTSPNGVRDANMAENVSWIRDHADADRIALWAHNGHVATRSFADEPDSPKTMGQHLRETLGDDYYALGFEFGRGSFQARPRPDATADSSLRSFSIDSIRPDAVAAPLDELDHSLAVLDFDAASDDPAVREWLHGNLLLRNVGSVYDDEMDETHAPVELAAAFDGLLFVAETDRAVPIDGN